MSILRLWVCCVSLKELCHRLRHSNIPVIWLLRLLCYRGNKYNTTTRCLESSFGGLRPVVCVSVGVFSLTLWRPITSLGLHPVMWRFGFKVGVCCRSYFSWRAKCTDLLWASLQWSEINTGRLMGMMSVSICAWSKMMKKSLIRSFILKQAF